MPSSPSYGASTAESAIDGPPELVHEAFLRQAERNPDKAAVVSSDGSCTYRELARWSAAVTAQLAAAGVRAGDLVGVAVSRGPALVAALIGILRAGCGYVALDIRQPARRLAAILGQAAADQAGDCVVLADASATGVLAEAGARVLEVAGCDGSERGEHRVLAIPAVVGDPDERAYVAFTSGSTGTPKGVVCCHGPVMAYLHGMIETFDVCPDDRVLALTNIVFDPSVRDIFGPLTAGATIVMATTQEVGDPQAVADLIEREQVTMCLAIVPRFLAVLLDELADRPRRTCLRTLLTCGEALTTALARRAMDVLRCEVVNQYGPTECTMVATYHRVGVDDFGGVFVPVGRVIGGAVVRVVDGWGGVVPVGVVGEIAVGGSGLARGYLGQAGLTAERFVPDGLGVAGSRLYLTGDLGRCRADGVVEFVGRADDQVKIRGFRVEPGEVAVVLAGHPRVSEAAVVAAGEGSGLRLVAFVVLDGVVGGGELREFARLRVPEYMVPSQVVVVDALPLTANGKLDRRALAALVPERQAGGAGVAPRSAVESVVAGIWAEVLGVERVGVADDFFELGGHSLVVTAVVARMRERLSVDVLVRDVFAHPTVERLASVVERAAPVVSEAVRAVSREVPLALSFAQQRLWFLDQLSPGQAVYNICDAYRITGPLEVGALAAAFGALVERHESLRTTFRDQAGVPVQVIGAPAPVVLDVEDVSGGGPAAAMARAGLVTEQEAARPFDLAAGPLVRLRVLRVGPGDHVLVVTMHHIVSDGWSMGIVASELGALYNAAVSGGGAAVGAGAGLAPLAVQYGDVALWQRQRLQGEFLDRLLGFWRAELAELPTLDLPADRPRPQVQSFRGDRVEIRLPDEVTAALRRVCLDQGATLFMALAAALQMLLARYTSGTDIPVGFTTANRTHSDTERIVGFFVNTLVLRTRLDGDPSYAQVLGRVRENVLAALSHQDLPFERLVEELAPARDLSRNPLFQVLFQVLNAPGELAEPEFTGLATQDLRPATRFSIFDLAVEAEDRDSGLHLGFTYATDLFDRATISRMAGHLRTLLAAAVADPSLRLSELPLLTEAEHAQLAAWNDTARPLPAATVIDAFLAQAAAAPGAPAVIDAGATYTYRDIDQRSQAIARALHDHGAGQETVVAICLPRGAGLITAVLATLRAGAAYLPLDTGHPPHRLRHMITDAGAAIIINDATTAHLTGDLDHPAINLTTTPHHDARPTTETRATPRHPIDPDTLAYIIYTSGSTGKPKGIAMPHRGLADLIDWYVGRNRPGRMLQFASVGFDISFLEIMWSLTSGGTVVTISDDARRDPVELARHLAAQKVTNCVLFPGLLQALAEVEREESHDLALDFVISTAEALQVTDEIKDLFNRLGATLENHYGPSEAHVVTALSLPADRASWPAAPTVGSAVGNCTIHVLDRWGNEVPIGIPGEIHVGGAHLARGYVGRPDLTATRFLPDAFGPPGSRCYQVGDLGRRRPDGTVEFIGRADYQLKVRGYRVEPGEIEATIRELPEVADVIVVGHKASDSVGTQLVAYVMTGAAQLTPRDIKHFVRSRLPEHMVPSRILLMPEMPLNPNGKIDRVALPAPETIAFQPDGAAEPPQSPTQLQVMRAWTSVLGVESAGLDDNFFDLGGSSLMIIKLRAALEEALGQSFAIVDLFKFPTVRTFAQHVASATESQAGDGAAADRAAQRLAAARNRRSRSAEQR